MPVSQLSVTLSGAYCRQLVSSHYESLLEEEWRERTHQSEAGGRSINSPLFRLHDTSLPGDCVAPSCRAGLTCQCANRVVLVNDNDKVDLRVGLSCTKDSVSTKMPSILCSNLAYIGYELCKKPQMFLAATITNHVIFLTQDGYIPLVRKQLFDDAKQGSIKRRVTRTGSRSGGRTGSLNENPTKPATNQNLLAKWALPNISPDPLETEVQEVKNLVSLHSDSAKEEIVGSVVRCLQDIFGVKDLTHSQISLLAVIYDKEHNNKPELLYIVKSKLTSAKLAEKSSSNMYDLAFLQGSDKEALAGDSLPLYRAGNTTPQPVNCLMVSDILREVLALTQMFGCVEFSALIQ